MFTLQSPPLLKLLNFSLTHAAYFFFIATIFILFMSLSSKQEL